MWGNKNDNSNQGGRGFGGGGGRGFRGGRSSRGRGGGRDYGGGGYNPHDNSNTKSNEAVSYNLCTFFVRSGNCRNGDGCRFAHNVAVAFTKNAHAPEPIKSIGVLNTDNGPKILTGSHDSTVKVWNLSTAEPSLEATIKATGKVDHIVVDGNTIMWSTDEQIAPDKPGVTVGTVYLLANPADMSTVAIKRSEEFPYTHPMKVRSFTIARVGGAIYVVTGGGEGNIRTWRFDETKGQFEHLMLLEGHIREVTAVLLVNEYLWSASADNSIKVWDMSSGKCVGTLSSSNGGLGHTDVVTCLESITPLTQTTNVSVTEVYIASGGGDGEVKLWKTNGEFTHSSSHQNQFITCLKTFQDALGGIQTLIIGKLDGSITIRSCLSMNILFNIESSICQNKSIWTICNLGQSCFATSGDDGNLIVWQVLQPLVENK